MKQSMGFKCKENRLYYQHKFNTVSIIVQWTEAATDFVLLSGSGIYGNLIWYIAKRSGSDV
jgi:hypothetical protein